MRSIEDDLKAGAGDYESYAAYVHKKYGLDDPLPDVTPAPALKPYEPSVSLEKFSELVITTFKDVVPPKPREDTFIPPIEPTGFAPRYNAKGKHTLARDVTFDAAEVINEARRLDTFVEHADLNNVHPTPGMTAAQFKKAYPDVVKRMQDYLDAGKVTDEDRRPDKIAKPAVRRRDPLEPIFAADESDVSPESDVRFMLKFLDEFK